MAAQTVTLVARGGRQVQFVEKDPAVGGVKDVYFAPDRSYVVAFYRKDPDAAGRERLERLVTTYRRNLLEKEGGSYYKDLFRWPECLVEHNGRTGIVVPVYDRRFYFPAGTGLDGVEKQGNWFTSAKNFNRNLPPGERGNLISYLRICVTLSRAVKRLHAAGLAHSDLSFKNCLVDPSSGSACIIDIDGLVVPGLFPPEVAGTPDFIAPEVMGTIKLPLGDPAKKLPCVDTDRHALAVLVYLYLLHRHPLRGSKVWSLEDEEQESLEMGEKALFIEHPTDPTNRRTVDPKTDGPFLPWIDTGRLPYTITGPYLSRLFRAAFVDHLHDPVRRPTADDWEEALVKTLDLILPCSGPSCPKSWFVFDNTRRPVCPYCGKAYGEPSVPVLDLYSTRDGSLYQPDNRRLMVFNNQYLYPWHAYRNVFPNGLLAPEQRRPLGYFAFHRGEWLLVNQDLPGLRDGEVPVPVGQAVKLSDRQRLVLSPGAGGRLAHVTLVRS
ncbi:MAG: kinase [Deltaproteobacteria bacterium]|jgi:uncharacterized Zn-finger protein|nr:kinase [Deltaproteobacteria bacterium]